MSGALAKVAKRRRYPVTLPNGETIHIRAMEYGEHTRFEALPKELKPAFVLGLILIEDDGSQVFQFKDKETDAEFAARMAVELPLDLPAINVIKEERLKIENVPSLKVLAKNSEETSTQG